MKDKEERLKILIEEQHRVAAEVKKNAQKEKTCYFALAKLKKGTMKRCIQNKGKDSQRKNRKTIQLINFYQLRQK